MTKYIVFFCLIIGTAQAQQQKPAGFRIEGRITGIPNGSQVSLSDANKPTDTLARTSVKDGLFVLTGHVKEPNLFELNFGQAKKKIPLFIGDESVKVTGDIGNLAGIKA